MINVSSTPLPSRPEIDHSDLDDTTSPSIPPVLGVWNAESFSRADEDACFDEITQVMPRAEIQKLIDDSK